MLLTRLLLRNVQVQHQIKLKWQHQIKLKCLRIYWGEVFNLQTLMLDKQFGYILYQKEHKEIDSEMN